MPCWVIYLEAKLFVKEDLRPKNHPCFCGIILVLWKKSLIQSFVVFWSILMKLWSYKVLNPAWVTSYLRMYKIFHPWFALHIFVNFMEKEPFAQFYGRFDRSSRTYEVAKFLIDLLVSPRSWRHTREWTHIVC